MNYNIGQVLSAAAQAYPNQPGLISRSGSGYRSWTFKEMDETADGFAHRLTYLGLKRGDRVMLMVRPSLEFITLTFALFKIGAVIILIDPGMGYKNLKKCIGQVKPEVFIGIARAHLFKLLFRKPFVTVRLSLCVGPSFGLCKHTLSVAPMTKSGPFPAVEMTEDDLAAILFTTGSTGPPKGVRYGHGVFQAQLNLIRDYYKIGPDDVDQPAFPLFALFSTGLGACTVIPEMDAARPARVDPAKFIRTIRDHKVTYSFGSPAIWNVVSTYCIAKNIKLVSLKKILMAGAPVPGELLERTRAILPEDAEIYTPYGATESLPIASITAREILDDTWAKTRTGKGVCVGRPLPSIEIRIIRTFDEPINTWDDALLLPANEIGEIVVRGPVVTRAYDNNEKENRLAKIADDDTSWHRMGDLGYLDDQGRLWFCGRKGHRVETKNGTLYTVCCEAFFNKHPAVSRSALVGIGPLGDQEPVMIVELCEKKLKAAAIREDLKKIAIQNDMTRNIKFFLVHPDFPVDIRHNAKIFREKLAVWAAEHIKNSKRKI